MISQYFYKVWNQFLMVFILSFLNDGYEKLGFGVHAYFFK